MHDSLLGELHQAIDSPDGAKMDALFLRLFARQYERNAPYRRYCDSLGASPESVTDWRDIPAAPVAAFRHLDLTCAPNEPPAAEFHSSGTTSTGKASRHLMDGAAVALYEHSLAAGFVRSARRIGFDPDQEIWALMPTPEQAPHSSLTHMLNALGVRRWFWDDWDAFYRALDERDSDEPITIFGTAIALAVAIENVPGPRRLPAGSVVIETGGFKGARREVERSVFYVSIAGTFGIPDSACIAEYGMCELSSQCYSQGVDGELIPSPWLRLRTIEPISGDDSPDGEPGLLRFYDLANFNSVAVIQTQDLGVISEGGGFKLLGRAPGAEVRGCSLMVS